MIDRDDREKLVKGNRLTGTTREMEREDGHLCTVCVCVCLKGFQQQTCSYLHESILRSRRCRPSG